MFCPSKAAKPSRKSKSKGNVTLPKANSIKPNLGGFPVEFPFFFKPTDLPVRTNKTTTVSAPANVSEQPLPLVLWPAHGWPLVPHRPPRGEGLARLVSWFGVNWVALGLVDLLWVGLVWVGLAWVGLRCFGLALIGLAWVGLFAWMFRILSAGFQGTSTICSSKQCIYISLALSMIFHIRIVATGDLWEIEVCAFHHKHLRKCGICFKFYKHRPPTSASKCRTLAIALATW